MMLTWKIGMLLTVTAFVAAITCCVLAEDSSTSRRKGRLLLASAVLLGSSCWFMGGSFLIGRLTLPRFHASGVIVRTHDYVSGKSHRTRVLVQIDPVTQVGLTTGDRRPGYRVGEHIDAEYEGVTGEIVSARLTSANGLPDGEDHRVIWVVPAILFLLGGYLIVAGLRRYRRDPEGAVVTPRYANADLDTQPDEASLLQLRDDGA
jgi:hypothetical protein